jgi:two-component system probable response regulator PhcQ
MQNQYDLKRYAILYVDDEEKALKYFVKTFGDEFRFMTATNAAEGLKLLEEHGDEIAILLSDQRMPGEKGVQLLERARVLRPRLVRMLVTAYADFSVTVDAVNLGNIFRYISKPLQTEDVRNTLHRAMEFFILQQERDDLLQEKLSVLQNVLITDRVMGLGVVAAAISSHLRNGLRAVHSFLELTPGRLSPQSLNLESLRDPSFWRDFHGMVMQQSARIGDLMGDLQSTASQEQDFDPGALITAEVESLRSTFMEKGITLTVKQAPTLPVLHGDPVLFSRMISLLLQSEVSMLPAGQIVTLQAEDSFGNLDLSLADDGPGMNVDALRSVFDPFFINILGPNRAGLTLMGAYFLAYHLGGKINAPRGKGTQLEISIPSSITAPKSTAEGTREFITNVLMNDSLWERLLPTG